MREKVISDAKIAQVTSGDDLCSYAYLLCSPDVSSFP